MIANSQLAQSCDDHFKCNCFHLIESQINQDRIIDGTNETTTSTQASTAIVNHVNSLPAMQLFTIPRLSPLFGLSFKLLFLFLLFYSAVPSVTTSHLPFTGFNSRNIRNSKSPTSSLSSSSIALYSEYKRHPEAETHQDEDGSHFIPLREVDSEKYANEMKCLYYNRTLCNKTKTGCGNTFQICHPLDGNDRPSSCYALWHNSSVTGVQIEFKGCWIGHSKDCRNSPLSNTQQDSADHLKQCIQTRSPNKNLKTLYFCCCSGLMCNQEVKHVPDTVETQTDSPEQSSFSDAVPSNGYRFPGIIIYMLFGFGIFFLFGVISLIVFFFGKCRHKPNSSDVPTSQPLLENCNSSGATGYTGLHPIQLKEIRAHGKFGSVWRAIDGRDTPVAVKVFALQDRSSWQIEKDVYSLPQMKHNNILTYLGAERRGEGFNSDLWIITEYHPNGSLWDYLKSHTINLKQLLTIIQGISKGLTHLHEELPATATQGPKPSIAHRDFKSKNVLISDQFRACIADFGLALVFRPNSTCGDAHGQVGTRRYMAPEVLEGAINFNRDSFLRIDMYACGLVLWELMSRCCFSDITCGEYRLPFEEEVGSNPSLEDMQEVVAQQKKRPHLQEAWFNHPGMKIVANTVQDCWDQDAEARISASTICERIQSIILNEDNCMSHNNHNSVNYRVAFTANNASANSCNTKNSFLMTAAHTNNAPIPNRNSHGTSFILRETST